MTKFVKLHEANRNDSTVLLNIDQIGAIQTGNSKDVYVRMKYNNLTSEGRSKPEYYFVKESFEEIERLINPPDVQAAPLIINLANRALTGVSE